MWMRVSYSWIKGLHPSLLDVFSGRLSGKDVTRRAFVTSAAAEFHHILKGQFPPKCTFLFVPLVLFINPGMVWVAFCRSGDVGLLLTIMGLYIWECKYEVHFEFMTQLIQITHRPRWDRFHELQWKENSSCGKKVLKVRKHLCLWFSGVSSSVCSITTKKIYIYKTTLLDILVVLSSHLNQHITNKVFKKLCP